MLRSVNTLVIMLVAFFVAFIAMERVIDELRGRLAEESPFSDRQALEDLRAYAGFRPAKAFAASVSLASWGWGFGYDDRTAAGQRALAECERQGEPCLLYAIGDRVVWDPAAVERRLREMVSSRQRHGALWRFYGETNPHGATVVMPPQAPSIVSDYHSSRGIMGRLRSEVPPAHARHDGIDIVAPLGTPVLAAADGTVVTSEFHEVAGLRILIAHGNGEGEDALAADYVHLQSSYVASGEFVRRGEVIGTVGVTGLGANSARPHLHLEIAGRNPHLYWHDGPGMVTCFEDVRAFSASGTRLTYPLACDGPD